MTGHDEKAVKLVSELRQRATKLTMDEGTLLRRAANTIERLLALTPSAIASAGGGEAVHQYRWRFNDGDWFGWFDCPPPEPSDDLKIETRTLYAHPPASAAPTEPPWADEVKALAGFYRNTDLKTVVYDLLRRDREAAPAGVVKALAKEIVRNVCELDDIPDPAHPDTIMVTVSDLEAVIVNALECAALAPDAKTAPAPTAEKGEVAIKLSAHEIEKLINAHVRVRVDFPADLTRVEILGRDTAAMLIARALLASPEPKAVEERS